MPKVTTKYIDAYVIVVPKKNVPKYKKMAKESAKVWMKHGALAYRECVGEDLNPDMGECGSMPFPKLTKLKPTETVWFSYVEYKNKTHRNSVNKKVMKYFEEKYQGDPSAMKDMPWDPKRFSWGGFTVAVNG